MCFSCRISHQNILYSFGIQTGSHSVAVLLYIYIILFSSILANTLLDCNSRLIPLYCEHSLLSPFRFYIGIIMDCLHSIGAIPSFQTARHTLHSSSAPASPAAFIILMLIPSIPGSFPVFADFSESSTSDRSNSGSCSRMSCAAKLLSLVSSFGFSNPSKKTPHLFWSDACLLLFRLKHL